MQDNPLRLKYICLNGFKSISDPGQTISFGRETVLIGSNGSGKSNLVSFFKMLDSIISGSFQAFVIRHGTADSLLFKGSTHTQRLHFSVGLEQSRDGREEEFQYHVSLGYGLPDRLVFVAERIAYSDGISPDIQEYHTAASSLESGLGDDLQEPSKVLLTTLSEIRSYQFHDTSENAKLKKSGYADDCRFLRSDGGNLAAYLRMLKKNPEYKPYYNRIIRHIRQVIPQFRDFVLETMPGNDNYLMLNWNSVNGDLMMGPHQLSDGTLRFMALTTLLLQPPDLLPKVIIIDEPELGLHPAAIEDLADMVHLASRHCQVVLATQSPRLLDEFAVEDIVVVEWDSSTGSSQFRRLDPDSLREWLDEFSLSNLWEKNVLGGRP